MTIVTMMTMTMITRIGDGEDDDDDDGDNHGDHDAKYMYRCTLGHTRVRYPSISMHSCN